MITSLSVPHFYLAFFNISSYGMSNEIAAFFLAVSLLYIAVVLNPFYNLGRHTTVRNEHHRMFSGRITTMRI
jgi:hypothetical protein